MYRNQFPLFFILTLFSFTFPTVYINFCFVIIILESKKALVRALDFICFGYLLL